MTSIHERALENVGLHFYEQENFAEHVGALALQTPTETQYVLRCPIKIPSYQDIHVPPSMQWCNAFIQRAFAHQTEVVGVDQPYAYLTIRSGHVTSQTDDLLHVDGFSMKVPHIPEQNYIWSNNHPTIVEAFPLAVPPAFNPLKHNLQYLIQDLRPRTPKVQQLLAATMYVLDPYVYHRRPTIPAGTVRTFIRLSFTAIPIDDVNNHTNPVFGTITTNNDGVKDFRDKLERFPVAA